MAMTAITASIIPAAIAAIGAAAPAATVAEAPKAIWAIVATFKAMLYATIANAKVPMMPAKTSTVV